MRYIFLLLVVLVFQGCTYWYYKTEDKLESKKEKNILKNCDMKYSLNIKVIKIQRTNPPRRLENWEKRDKPEYMTISEKVFKEKGSKALYVEDTNKANFIIDIQNFPYLSALPQEYLTGLSLGLIPSWGERKAEYNYKFKNLLDLKEHVYKIDNVTINHLILTPLTPVSIMIEDEKEMFKSALEDFLDNS